MFYSHMVLSLTVLSINLIKLVLILCKTIMFIDLDPFIFDTQFIVTHHDYQRKFYLVIS